MSRKCVFNVTEFSLTVLGYSHLTQNVSTSPGMHHYKGDTLIKQPKSSPPTITGTTPVKEKNTGHTDTLHYSIPYCYYMPTDRGHSNTGLM